jgi:hypothetical protein
MLNAGVVNMLECKIVITVGVLDSGLLNWIPSKRISVSKYKHVWYVYV